MSFMRRCGHRLGAKAALAALLIPVVASGASANEFRKVKMVIVNGDDSTESAVNLIFEPERLLVTASNQKPCLWCPPRGGGDTRKMFDYSSIKGATYSYSTHARWKEGVGAAVAIGVLATPLFFTKSKKHWLTIRAGDDFVVLRLDKTNFRLVLPLFETKTGIRVERVGEE